MHHSEKTMRSSKQLKTRESASTCLPSDILFDILARLPIKSIIRFVCISKAWKFIIKDPKFIKLYNEIHADELSPNTLIYEHEESLWSMDLDNKREWRCQPLNRRSEDSLLVGSCNGLLCYSSDKGEHVAILNPMTRTRFVPDGNTTDIHSSALIGFGYAGFTDDYKVIRISRAKKADDHQIVEITMVDVYSLNKDSWQSCQLPWSTDQYGLQLGFLRYSYQRSSAVVYNAVHWLVEKSVGKNKNHVIIAFDLRYVGKHWEVVVPPQF